MEIWNVKVIIIPVINIKIGTNTCPFGTEIEEDVDVSCSITLNEICKTILNNVGLGHMVDNFKAYVKINEKENMLVSSLIEHLNVLQVSTLFGDLINIKILTTEDNDDFNKENVDETVCKDINDYLVNKFNSIKENLKKCPLIQSAESLDDDETSNTDILDTGIDKAPKDLNTSHSEIDDDYDNLESDWSDNNNEF